MDRNNVALETDERQDSQGAAKSSEVAVGESSLSRADRRLLLGASLRLLGRRFISGKPISQVDVLRVASLADDVSERAA